MVDEVNITNVGGKDGVASEVTLKNLQSAIENLAGKKGLDPKEANKGLLDLKKGLGQSKKQIQEELEARGENTDALDDHTDALGKASRGLISFGGAIIGSGIASVKGMSSALISGSNNLSDFTEHIPLAGGVISMFTGIIDQSVNTFQSMVKTGAAFDYSMGQLRTTAAQAGLSLEEFAGLVNENAEQFAAFGGTVTQGARRTVQLVGALGDQRESLMAMGLTFEDINEQMTTYQMLTRAGARAETRNRTEQAEAAASLTKNMLTLSKLTGEDIKAQQDKIAQAQMDVAFQRELAKMDEEERQKLNQAMAEAQATGGEVAVNALKAEVLGMPPLTEELQTFVATQGESFQVLQESIARVRDSSVTAEQFEEQRARRMGDYLETQLAAQNRYDTALAAGAAGAEGIVATLSEQMGMSADVLMKYVTDTGNGLEFARKAFEEDLASGEIQAGREGELGAMAAFRDSLRNARSSLMENLVNPLMNLITPAIVETTASLDNFTESQAFTEFNETIRNKLEDFKSWFGDWLEKFKEDPQQAWNDLMENHIKPFFDKAIQGAKDAIGSAFKDLITSPSVVNALVVGFGTLFAARAVTSALTKGIAGMFAKAQAARTASTTAGTTAGAAAKSGTAGRLLKGGAKLASKAALPLTALYAGFKGVQGSMNAEEILGMEEGEEAGFGDRLAASIGSTLEGLSFSLIDQESVARGLTGRSNQNQNETQQQNVETPQQDTETAQQALSVTDEQLERLEKLVGFAPQVTALTKSIGTFQDEFNSLDLNYRHIDRTNRALEKLDSMSSIESKFRAIGDYLSINTDDSDKISERQIKSLQSLVGLEPKLDNLTGSIGTFQDEFNSLDLNYREIDRTTRSLEKMTEQLENINEQLKGGEDSGFFGSSGNNNEDQTTAGDVLSDLDSGQKEQLEKLNRIMTDILSVLLQSNDMNKKQLGAARALSGNLYQGF